MKKKMYNYLMIYLYKGDNLEKIPKVTSKPNIVYLDPPYGTKNNNLIYKDGKIMDEWLKFFIVRLKEIKKIIQPNSVIYTSIGHEEVANAKNALDLIFGRKAFVSLMPRMTINVAKTTKTISRINDFLLVYKTGRVEFEGLAIDTASYRLEDEFVKERGKYQLRRLDYNTFKYSGVQDTKIVFNDIEYFPGSKQSFSERKEVALSKDWCWLWSDARIKFAIENGYIINKNGFLYKKTYTKSSIIGSKKQGFEVKNYARTKPITSLHYSSQIFSNNSPKTEIEKLFSYPKSDVLINDLFIRPKFKKKIILDPFAGTGTSGIVAHQLGIEAHLIQIEEEVSSNSEIYIKHGIKNIFNLTKKILLKKVGKDLVVYED